MKWYKESILNPLAIRRVAPTKQASCLLIFIISACLVGIGACGKSRRPGLSDKELFALQDEDTQKETDELPQLKKDVVLSDRVQINLSSGMKRDESRAVDPANPPVVIDLANRNLNIKKFDLSEYYSNVRYYKLKHPLPASEGNFLFDVQTHTLTTTGWANSNFYFLKDSIVAGDVFFGYHSYDYQGNFLNTLKTYDFYMNYDITQNRIEYETDDYNRAIAEANSSRTNWHSLGYPSRSLWIDQESWASYVYGQRNTSSNDFLITFDAKGDTICRFIDYNPQPDPTKKRLPTSWRHPFRMYYYEGIPTVQQSYNDTVYRVTAPDRIVPAYVLNYGRHKLDMELAEDLSDKFFPDIWKETSKYVLMTYNRDFYSKSNVENGIVQYFYSFYDKQSKQFYHFCEPTTIPKKEFLIDNSVPNALPFILSYANVYENGIMVYYSKKRLNDIIQNKDFPSLPPEQQKLLQDSYNDLEENEVLIMFLQ